MLVTNVNYLYIYQYDPSSSFSDDSPTFLGSLSTCGLTCLDCIYPPEESRHAVNSWPDVRQQYTQWKFSPVYHHEDSRRLYNGVEQPEFLIWKSDCANWLGSPAHSSPWRTIIAKPLQNPFEHREATTHKSESLSLTLRRWRMSGERSNCRRVSTQDCTDTIVLICYWMSRDSLALLYLCILSMILDNNLNY